jgi:putative transposase
MELYKNKYRIDTTRLKNWDYGSPGFYFVTICTKNRECFLGEIMEMVVETQNFVSLQPSEIGNVAHENWSKIPHHFPFVRLDEFTVMPDHVHGILFFEKPGYDKWETNKFGPQSQNLASVIRGYKTSVKTFATTNNIEFEWQARYYDRIIRSAKDLNNVRKYIIDNPSKWESDRNNIENLLM